MISYLLYIDPGSGSFLVQALVAAALGVSFFFKSIKLFFIRCWYSIKSLFSRAPKEDKK